MSYSPEQNRVKTLECIAYNEEQIAILDIRISRSRDPVRTKELEAVKRRVQEGINTAMASLNIEDDSNEMKDVEMKSEEPEQPVDLVLKQYRYYNPQESHGKSDIELWNRSSTLISDEQDTEFYPVVKALDGYTPYEHKFDYIDPTVLYYNRIKFHGRPQSTLEIIV